MRLIDVLTLFRQHINACQSNERYALIAENDYEVSSEEDTVSQRHMRVLQHLIELSLDRAQTIIEISDFMLN